MVAASVVAGLVFLPLDQAVAADSAGAPGQTAERFLVVDCLLPGQVRKLGRRLTFIAPRRAVRTSGSDCEIRGGEFATYDRADYRTSLAIWLPEAESGDPRAQTFVGEIHEKGLGRANDYQSAAGWYEKAGAKGYKPALVNLAHLYAEGLGVPRDPARASALLAQAAGLPAALAASVQFAPPVDPVEIGALTEANAGLARQVAATQAEVARLRSQVGEESRMVAAERARLQQEATRQHSRAETVRQQADALARREADVRQREAAMREEETRLGGLKAQLAAAIGSGPRIELIVPTLAVVRGDSEISVGASVRSLAIVGRALSVDGLSTVAINGEPARPNGQGVFNADITLGEGSTRIEIVAVDQQGRSGSTGFNVARAPVPAAPRTEDDVTGAKPAAKQAIDPAHIPVGTPHALLIGNARYQTLPSLATPKADVEALAELLRTRFGFTVTVLYDATRYQILSALNDLRTRLTERDDLLVYYAGHGQMVSMENRSRGYWLPVDAELKNTANWISTPDITDAVATMNVHKVLLVSDSCYSGLLTRGLARLTAAASAPMRESYLKSMAAPRSRNVLTSGGDTPVMDGGGGKHSVFARTLLDTLANADQPFVGQDLASAVEQQVAHAARAQEFSQMPQYGPLQLSGHESGDFVFLPRGGAAPPKFTELAPRANSRVGLASSR